MAELGSGVIQSAKEFKPTPAGLQRKWTLEVNAALKARKKWIEQASKADKRFLGEVSNNETSDTRTRINLYHSNTNIVLSILYGQVPKVDVSRRFNDPNDTEARAASEAMERHLNTDIEDDADDFQSETADALQDWKITGLGQCRLRYEIEEEDVAEVPAKVRKGKELAPAVPAHSKKSHEDIRTDYIHWRDFIWSPCRRWKEVRWVAFRAEMTRDEANKRFGEKIGSTLPMQQRKPSEDGEVAEDLKDAWSRISLWEIWNKEDKSVYWYCEGYNRILDKKKDPMGLAGFFPCPRPLIANVTTSKFMPKPDLELDRHLYDEIDDIGDRLRKLVKSARVTGSYNSAFPELGRILEEAVEGQLVGVKNWSAFSEKGGLKGAIDIIDLTPIIGAIDVLTHKLVEKIQLLDQVIGLSDIVRGEQTRQETATTSRLKAGFASTRLQTDQDKVARFATDLQRLRAEIISKHYDAETIIDRSNMLRVEVDDQTKQPDMDLIMRAVKLIKSPEWQFRIEVKADSIALRDYATLKQERVEVIGALTSMFQQAVPMVQIFPQAAPHLLTIAKWLISATKGSQQLEVTFDQFAAEIQKAATNPPPPKEDPKLEAVKVKAQAEMQKAGAQVQQTQVDGQVHMAKAAMDMKVAAGKHQLDVNKLAAQTEAEAQRAAIAFQEQGRSGKGSNA